MHTAYTKYRVMNLRFILLAFTLLSSAGCRETVKNERNKAIIPVSTDSVAEATNLNDTIKKYEIKSGIVRYEVILKTISVDMRFHTILYFDNFGLTECLDTYSGDTLTTSNMSNGLKTYKIDHIKKIAYYLTRSHFGVQPKYGWKNITEDDKNTGKVKKIPNKMIAGKSCEAYEVNSGIAKVTFAGWKDIVMLADINSPGGRSYTIATYINTDGVPVEKFQIPANYKIK